MSKSSLYRKEALESRRGSWLGGISVAQPVPMWVLAVSAFAVMTVVVLFLFFGEYTRRSRITGQLVPSSGLATIVAPAAGVVEEIYLREGDAVAANASLTRINVPRNTAGGDTQAVLRDGFRQRRASAEQSLRSHEQLLGAQLDGQNQRLATLRSELAQLTDEIATRVEQVRLADEMLEHYRTAARSGVISKLQLDQQEQQALEQRSRQQTLERQALATRRLITEVEQSLRELPAQRNLHESSTRKDLALLDQESIQAEASGEVVLKAPVDGVVSSRLIEPGQSVQPGQSLMSILPQNSRLQAQLLVPNQAVGFIAPGDRVLLRYQAFPYQKFGFHEGKVARVSRSALTQGEVQALTGAGQAGPSLYRVLVDIERQSISAYGKEEALRPGMIVEADILGERRKLYEWLFEPLFAAIDDRS